MNFKINHKRDNMDVFCKECAESLKQFGQPCYEVYRMLSKIDRREKLFFFKEKNCPNLKNIIKFLESKRLVLSSEIDNEIVRVILNHRKSYNETFDINVYCFCQLKISN